MSVCARCPACGEPLPDDASSRRVWCTDKCRAWVHNVGGPETAAALLEGWATDWEAVVPVVGQEAKTTAAELRERASRLRELVDG